MRPQLLAVPLAILFMLLGVVIGVVRLLFSGGITAQPLLPRLNPFHGELMVFGFLAVLIVTERYIGALPFKLNRSIHYMTYLVAVGAVLKVAGLVAGRQPLDALGSIVLAVGLVIYLYLLWGVGRQSAQPLPMRFMMLGGLLLLLTSLITIGKPATGNLALTLLMLSFPVFTILGERIELSRFLAPAVHARARWGLGLVAVASALLLVEVLAGTGVARLIYVAWAVLVAALAVPLFWAERPLMRGGTAGLSRYLGRHLLLAYLWLLLGLALMVLLAVAGQDKPLFDAATHSISVGFVGTMILAHGPVIAPALLGRAVAVARLSYYPLVLLTLGNFLRVGGYGLERAGLEVGLVVGVSGL
ncbi:MAG: hypothetical protein AAB270_04515, partial [Chloroflexota bacterium]